MHHRLGLHVFCKGLQLAKLFSGQESFGVAYRLLLDGPQTCSLIFREIEFLLPCEKASRTLRIVLYGTRVPALLDRSSLALVGPARRSRASFVALLGAKSDSACEHSAPCENFGFHAFLILSGFSRGLAY
jgi:hypothetical protein